MTLDRPAESGMIMDACDHKGLTIVKVHRGLYPILNAMKSPMTRPTESSPGPERTWRGNNPGDG